ncbi:MAG: hypothetical protein ACK5UI_02910 [Bacteroidota bacterium]
MFCSSCSTSCSAAFSFLFCSICSFNRSSVDKPSFTGSGLGATGAGVNSSCTGSIGVELLEVTFAFEVTGVILFGLIGPFGVGSGRITSL